MTIEDQLREAADKYRRWDFQCDDEGVVVCKGDHEKSDACELHQVRLSPRETLQILSDLHLFLAVIVNTHHSGNIYGSTNIPERHSLLP